MGPGLGSMPAISSSILTSQAGIDWSVIRKIYADKVLVSSGRRGKWKTLQLAVVELVDALRTSSSSTSLVILGYPWLSLVILGYPWLSLVILGYPWLSLVILGYP